MKQQTAIQNSLKYFYYPTGELARVELGEDQVQGIDYAYTLQGWLKAMNGSSIGDESNRGNFDMGEDARQAPNNLHQRFGADAAAYTLGYYQGDYKSITSNPAIANMPPQHSTDLYNGNISYKISSLSNLSGQPLDVQTSTYRYDQLNRLKSSDIFTAPNLLSSNQISNPVTGNRYKTSYSYDANGNISDLQRHDDQGTLIDHLSYHYHKKANGYSDDKNQLLYVDDAVSTPNLNTDPEDQEPGNYAYDATGNLIKDEAAEIAQISWTAYGKVSEVIRSSGSTMPNLSFHYDASGNRVLKIVKPYNYLNDASQWKYEYYVRDASGNILAVYEKNYDAQRSKQTLVLTEQPFYGSARLGVINRDLEINPDDTASPQYSRVMGRKVYELFDHLNNVNVVLSDRKIAIEDPNSPGTLLRYEPELTSFSEYYPFGAQKNNRNGSVGIGYRYLFSGMEQDGELKGQGNSYNFGARIYDPRISHFLSTDPMFHQREWLSPYNYVQNNPINRIDPTGMLDTEYKDESGKTIANTHDGRDQTVFVRDENVDAFRQYMQSHAEGGGDVNDPQYNDKLIRQYGFAAQFDQNIGIKGDAGMLEWAGTGGIVSGVKGLISAVKNARNLYKTYRTAKAAKASANLVKAAKAAGEVPSGFLNSLKTTVSAQKQARHLASTAGHGKGFLNNLDDAQTVLDAVHSGEATFLGTSKAGHQVFRFNGVTGTNVNVGAGITRQPTNVFMVKGTASPSIVPTNPLWVP